MTIVAIFALENCSQFVAIMLGVFKYLSILKLMIKRNFEIRITLASETPDF